MLSQLVLDRGWPCVSIPPKSKKVTAKRFWRHILYHEEIRLIFQFLLFTFNPFFLFTFRFRFWWDGLLYCVCLSHLFTQGYHYQQCTWWHLINAAWPTCAIVLTSCTEYFRNWPKFRSGWKLMIVRCWWYIFVWTLDSERMLILCLFDSLSSSPLHFYSPSSSPLGFVVCLLFDSSSSPSSFCYMSCVVPFCPCNAWMDA